MLLYKYSLIEVNQTKLEAGGMHTYTQTRAMQSRVIL
jgi:hypothetical protein